MCFYRLDEGFKSSSYLTETLLDPETGHSFEPLKSSFNRAHNVNDDLWTWFERPDNKVRLARFGAAMTGAKNMAPPEAILEGSLTSVLHRASLSDLWEYPIDQGTHGIASLRVP
jgi:hypothetical protein